MNSPQFASEPKPPNRLHAWSYVAVQTVILGLLIFLNASFGFDVKKFVLIGRVFEWLGILGVLASAASLRRSLTAVPLPKTKGKLSTNGLYRFVRHPMYTSVLLLVLGIALLSGNLVKYVLALSLVMLFYFKSVYEEKYLVEKYSDYKAYAEKIPRFIPFM
ncbi:MAG: isoprenylcysteine carboxylmethyltransferase family protein [Actinomycetota bacterium]